MTDVSVSLLFCVCQKLFGFAPQQKCSLCHASGRLGQFDDVQQQGAQATLHTLALVAVRARRRGLFHCDTLLFHSAQLGCATQCAGEHRFLENEIEVICMIPLIHCMIPLIHCGSKCSGDSVPGCVTANASCSAVARADSARADEACSKLISGSACAM